MASIWNHRISISLFGEAEGPAIGVVLDNIPPGEYVDIDALARFMTRRTRSVFLPDDPAHQREQLDFPQVLSGLINNRTTGSPLCAFLNNPRGGQTVDFQELSHLARPGHADYTGAMRYRGFADVRSGGHLSERMTIPLCFAGAVCQQMLERRGIYVGAHVILGLPGEDDAELIRQARMINQLPITTLKLHQLQLIKGTVMAREYEQSPFRLFSAEEYIDAVISYISHIRRDVVLERFVSSSPKDLLLAPNWNIKNYEFVEMLKKKMRELGVEQGCKV